MLMLQVRATGRNSCVIEHVLAVKPLLPIPGPVAHYTKSIFTRQVSNILNDLQAEIERQEQQGNDPYAVVVAGAGLAAARNMQ